MFDKGMYYLNNIQNVWSAMNLQLQLSSIVQDHHNDPLKSVSKVCQKRPDLRAIALDNPIVQTDNMQLLVMFLGLIQKRHIASSLFKSDQCHKERVGLADHKVILVEVLDDAKAGF